MNKESGLNRERIQFEELTLRCRHAEFPARYMAASNLRALVQGQPHHVRQETVVNLEAVLRDRHIVQHRQALFLFREVAKTLADIYVGHGKPLSGLALAALKRPMHDTAGAPHRAVAEALGALPFAVRRPRMVHEETDEGRLFSWKGFAVAAGLRLAGTCFWAGRSLVASLEDRPEILVVKFARRDDDTLRHLRREAVFMENLRFADYPDRFDVPVPIKVENRYLVSVRDVPDSGPVGLSYDSLAIAFLAHQDYFSYPNDPQNRLSPLSFSAVMRRNAMLFGCLAGKGMVHTAPIPLFHNRVQRRRREDNGVYDWPLGGRLDQWISSCRHPNFGVTGIRDFEHFIPFGEDGRALYWYIGVHFLSMLLVAASYFRNQHGAPFGFDRKGAPCDSRDFFDGQFLKFLVQEIFKGYYTGFTGSEYKEPLPFDLDRLSVRMIDEMGVDRHMDEVLRIVDQHQMTDKEFRNFLTDRGFSEREARCRQKGTDDIVILTGPHLGGFNERISIPELIEATAAMAATCIVGRYALKQLV